MDNFEKVTAVLEEFKEVLKKDVELIESLIGSETKLLNYYLEKRKEQTKEHQECLQLTMLKLNH